jgi:uncharacterized MAPEG superfamily protein
MTLAYWCVLIAAVLPYVWVGFAKYPLREYDNNAPRDYEEKLTGRRRRAHWAHSNAFEAFAPFAAAAIIAHQAHANQAVVNALALAFIAARILHGVLYMADQAALRSLVWSVGYLCVVALFVAAALA